MNEIQDLKNYVLAIQDKINNLTVMLQSHSKKDDNLNEILNLIHNQNFEKSRFTQSLFENVFPDIMFRIASLEQKLHVNRKLEIDKEILLSKKIRELGLPQRTINGLMAEGIHHVSDLIKKSESDILKIPNMGRKSLNDIKEALSRHNLNLRT